MYWTSDIPEIVFKVKGAKRSVQEATKFLLNNYHSIRVSRLIQDGGDPSKFIQYITVEDEGIE